MNDDYNILKEWGIVKSENIDTTVCFIYFKINRKL